MLEGVEGIVLLQVGKQNKFCREFCLEDPFEEGRVNPISCPGYNTNLIKTLEKSRKI